MIIAETSVFTRRVPSVMDEEEYRLLQLELIGNPLVGSVIPGSGGLRKLRWRGKGQGKRGGSRVIYYFASAEETILMLMVYGKAEKDDLSKDQMKILSDLVRREFG